MIRPKISLGILLLVAVPFTWLALDLGIRNPSHPPVVWETFTFQRLSACRNQGKPVFVLGAPTFHAGSQPVLEKLFGDPRVRRSFHRGEFAALKLEYDDWTDDVRRLMDQIDYHTMDPFCAFFDRNSPNGEPVSLDAKHVLERLSMPLEITVAKLATLAACIVLTLKWLRRPRSSMTG